MKINGYELVNEEKVQRVLDAVGEEAPENVVIAEYDKLGGAVYRGKDKVKTGSFYDFKLRKVRTEPVVVFVYRINGKVVEVEDNVELPGEIRAAKLLAEMENKEEEEKEGEEPKKRGRKSSK